MDRKLTINKGVEKMKLQIPMRKKLLFAIVGLIINWFVAYLRQRGVDVTPEEQTAIMDLAQQISGAIVGLFMIAQGIADHGKEAAKIAKEGIKTVLILFLCLGLLSIGMPAFADLNNPPTETNSVDCTRNLTECEGCPPIVECPAVEACPEEKDCSGAETFIQIITNVNVKEAIIYVVVASVTGVAAYFAAK